MIRTRLERHTVAVVAVGTLVALAVLAGVVWLSLTATRVEGQRDAVGQAAIEQADTIERACARDDEVARALQVSGQCERARDVQEKVADAGVTITVPARAVIDQAELIGYVRDQVAVYCGQRGGCVPPSSVVVGVVADYLSENPPEPGRAPTELEIRDAAEVVIRSDPGAFRGEAGADASDEQVAAQVAAYCAARAGCRGAAGSDGADGGQGPQGVSVVSLVFIRDGQGSCTAEVTLYDPASETARVATAPAGDAACEAPPTTTTTTTTATLLPGGG